MIGLAFEAEDHNSQPGPGVTSPITTLHLAELMWSVLPVRRLYVKKKKEGGQTDF